MVGRKKIIPLSREIEDYNRAIDPEGIKKLTPYVDPAKAKEFETNVERIYNDPSKDLNTKAFEIAELYDPVRIGERG